MTSLPALPRILALWLLLAAFSISPLTAVSSFLLTNHESPSDRGVIIFINTSPYGARVSLDGQELEGRTPMVIEAPAAGERTIQIRKTGFGDSEISFSVETGSVIVVELNLPQTGSNIFFQDGVILGTDSEPLPPGGYSLNPGNYKLSEEYGLGTFTPVYPNQKWIDGLNIAIPIVTVFAGGMMVTEALSPRSDGRISPFTITALVIDLLMAGADIGLHVHRAKWRKTWETDPAEATPLWAENDYQLAESSLASGELLQARYLFDRYAMIYPLNKQTPHALYRSARLAYMQGDFEACS
ncbi:MAG: PEGA domain-containing protein, partial [Spirochaetaceae bacterium]|nr:PEGA domain-containing protein [Spirochaetaceae bacterium]